MYGFDDPTLLVFFKDYDLCLSRVKLSVNDIKQQFNDTTIIII